MSFGSNSQTRLQRGHFTLKSSVLAPTAMSYMGQDFIANHMKSHYRRIMSAKVHDQKKRAVLESRAGTPASLRTRSPSMEFLSSSHNGMSPLNSTTNWQSPGRRQATGTPIHRSLSTQSLDRHYPPAGPSPSPRNMPTHDRSTPVSARLLSKPPASPIAKQPQSATRKGHHKTRLERNQRTERTLNRAESSTLDNLNGNVNTLLASHDEPFHAMENSVTTATGNTSYAEICRRSDDQNRQPQDFKNTGVSVRHDGVPHLDLTDVQYSHRGPPSIRTNDSTDFKANIWEEEQQYLKFISDVTTDILARGIFSNRVLKQVFEMHIERRKDYLDESRLREMIEQLKEDLGITDS
ncbi:uncharacterized protein LOC144634627 isoform X2 [Oculina patagonica]